MRSNRSDFVPDLMIHKVPEIPFRELARRGLADYIFDLDNTLVPRKALKAPQENVRTLSDARIMDWIRSLIILSNVVVDRKWAFWGPSRVARVETLARQFEADYLTCVWPNLKPKPAVFHAAARQINATPGRIVVVGDQVSTDIAGGNRASYFTILVDPIGTDNLVTAIRRSLVEPRIRLSTRYGSIQ